MGRVAMLPNDVTRCAGRIPTPLDWNGPVFVACADRERCRRFLERAHGRVFSSALRASNDAPCAEFIGESGDA